MKLRKFNRIRRKRYPGRNRHHFLFPRCRGGKNTVQNLLLMHVDRHEAWHRLFGVMTAEEAVNLLLRAIRMKKRQAP